MLKCYSCITCWFDKLYLILGHFSPYLQLCPLQKQNKTKASKQTNKQTKKLNSMKTAPSFANFAVYEISQYVCFCN